MPILRGEFVRLKRLTRDVAIRRYMARPGPKRLHLGCGTNHVEGWLNVDKFSAHADAYVNAYGRFPFPDDSFELVYSEHMIEHIRLNKVRHVLSEVYRVTRPGGLFRVTTPDLELLATKYLEGDREFFRSVFDRYEKERERGRARVWPLRTPGGAFMVSAVREFYNHRWLFDFEGLRECLLELGFSRVEKRGFGESLVEEAGAMDQAFRSWETLYVDAVK